MKKDTTRTIIELVGYQLSPIMNNEKTKIISFLHMNLKGGLPIDLKFNLSSL